MKERRQSKFPSNDIAKKIALITGGNIHNGERETSLPSRAGVNERIIAHSPRSITPEMSPSRKFSLVTALIRAIDNNSSPTHLWIDRSP
jgi:hypothetical protein